MLSYKLFSEDLSLYHLKKLRLFIQANTSFASENKDKQVKIAGKVYDYKLDITSDIHVIKDMCQRKLLCHTDPEELPYTYVDSQFRTAKNILILYSGTTIIGFATFDFYNNIYQGLFLQLLCSIPRDERHIIKEKYNTNIGFIILQMLTRIVTYWATIKALSPDFMKIILQPIKSAVPFYSKTGFTFIDNASNDNTGSNSNNSNNSNSNRRRPRIRTIPIHLMEQRVTNRTPMVPYNYYGTNSPNLYTTPIESPSPRRTINTTQRVYPSRGTFSRRMYPNLRNARQINRLPIQYKY